MKITKVFIWFLALLAIITGTMDVLIGVKGQANIGVSLSESGWNDPVLDSQVRYLGAIWCGFGCLLIYCLTDMIARRELLMAALGFVVFGGIGRGINFLLLGLPDNSLGAGFIVFALIVELMLVPIVIAFLHRAREEPRVIKPDAAL